MGLLSPWFLAGLAAVGLPVWFHLLRKHRSTPRPFSSLMFFEQQIQSSVKHRRLHYLLLFSLRTALVILLALAFASPFLPGGPLPIGQAGKLVVLAVDNSFSMRQGDRLERARRQAARVVAALRPADRAQVLTFAGQVRLEGEQTAERAVLQAALRAVPASDSRASYADLVRAVRSLVPTATQPVELHLFSDLQRSGLPQSFRDLELPPGVRLVIHRVENRALPNWAVESVTAPVRVSELSRVRVKATVAGFGTPAASRRVSLLVSGRVLETKTVALPAAGRAMVEFSALEAPYGWNRAEVRLEDHDEFPWDDRFLFALERAEPLRVLFVHEARDQRSPLYFRAALEASAESSFVVETVPASGAGGASLSRYAFIVLSDAADIAPAFEATLRDYVRRGGSLWLALGPSAAGRGRVPVLGHVVDRTRNAAVDPSQRVEWLDAGHPSARHGGRWAGVRFYHVAPARLEYGHVIAQLSDLTPLLAEETLGAGRVLVFTSTFDNISNDLPLHTSFVPFIEQTARYLAGIEAHPASALVDGMILLRKPGDPAAAEVFDPDGRRLLTLAEAAKATHAPVRREGFFEVRRSEGRFLVAVNADRRESDFSVIPEETLSLWENTGQGSATSAAGSVETARRVLAWPLLAAALLVALAESLVANRYLSLSSEAA